MRKKDKIVITISIFIFTSCIAIIIYINQNDTINNIKADYINISFGTSNYEGRDKAEKSTTELLVNERKKDNLLKGATAKDNVDGNLTSSIKVSSVDFSKVGKQTTTYTVTDKAGNKTTAKATLTEKSLETSCSVAKYVTVSSLNVCKSAGADSSKITSVAYRTKVTVIATIHDSSRVKIKLSNGITGYVNGKYLSTTRPAATSGTVKDTSTNEEFQAFIERWKLSDLLPESRTMTTEQQDEFIHYFQQFDDVTRNYIILLLQGIAADTITLGEDTNDHINGVYLMSCQFYLYDMNQDGFPEFILKTGSCEAAYMYTVYTIVNGELIKCGELNGSHSSLYTNGSGRIVRYEGIMGVYNIDISTLDGTTLKTQKIADGVLDYSKQEDYPKLEKYHYGDYNQDILFSDIPTLFLTPTG